MDEPIISRARIIEKARTAFREHASRDSHNMNPSSALDDWLAEYDRLAGQPHHAPAGAQRIDARQADV